MERIPILRMGECLLVTIQVDMHDRLATVLKDDLANRIAETRARGVLIDISALDLVDSFIARMFGAIAQMARIMDAETALVGMQPSVAITLVEMGVTMVGVRTALSVEKGMALLRARIEEEKVDDEAPYAIAGGDQRRNGSS
jgi:rsbT antagonist protein RsbS